MIKYKKKFERGYNMSAKFQVEKDGFTKNAFAGFSWTTWFFNFFVPIFRADLKGFLSLLGIVILQIIVAFILSGSFLGSMLGLIYWALGIYIAFWYNKNHFSRLLAQGYRVLENDEYSNAVAKGYGLIPYTEEDKNDPEKLSRYRGIFQMVKSQQRTKFFIFIGLYIVFFLIVIVIIFSAVSNLL